MSNIDNWSQTLSENKKGHVKHYISAMPRQEVNTIRIMMLEYSFDTIDDPLKENYINKFKDSGSYSSVDVLTDFIDNSPFWWHAREWARFVVGYHRQIPNVAFNLYAKFAPHFPHISREDDSRIAMVMDQKKAEADLHTTMKIGRYLSKQTDAPESAIPDISNIFANRDKTYHLEEARTPAEIQWVYENGPSSCMGKTIREAGFRSTVHPTHAYASPDIKILFVRDLNNPNRVISRTVASAINDTYVRIFGNEGVILPLLTAAKITKYHKGGLNNHRLLNIEEERDGETKHVGPYLDSGSYPIHTDPTDTKYLIINPDDKRAGEHVGHSEISYSQKGYIDTPPQHICEFCNDSFSQENIFYYEHAELWSCHNCREDNLTLVYDRMFNQQFVRYDDMRTFSASFATGVSSYDNGRLHTENTLFTTEEEFELCNHYPYRDTEDIFLRLDDAIRIPNRNFYVHSSEVVNLNYTKANYLAEDTISFNNRRVAKEHLDKDHKFKYSTLEGFDVNDIVDNLDSLYFSYVHDVSSSDYVYITGVSKTQLPGYISINDYWINAIKESHGFKEYSTTPATALLSTYGIFVVIPDSPDGRLFESNSINEYRKFRTSGWAATVSYQIDNMATPLTFADKSKRKNRVVKKRKTSFDDAIDAAAYAANIVSDRGTSATSDRSSWVQLNTTA